jgi:hypothetical protein
MDSEAAAAAITAALLFSRGLAKRQPALLAFSIITATGVIAFSVFPLYSSSYFWTCLISRGISDVIAIAAIRELFSTILAGYPGIQTAARWVLNGALAVSAIASLNVIIPVWGGARDSSHLFYVIELHRSIVFSLAVMIISLLLLLSHYPLRLQKSTYTLSYLFGAIVLADAAGALIATMSHL